MQIVSDIERCRKLKDAGFPQGCCQFYYIRLYSEKWELVHKLHGLVESLQDEKPDWIIAAHTVDEMVEWLESRLRKHNPIDPPTLEIEFDTDHVHIRTLSTAQIPTFTADTLSDVVSDMVVWVLKKEGK